jgi:hypothetical protein
MDNLIAIENCKNDIKAALIEKGGDTYMDDVDFYGYADKIRGLQLESGDTPAPTPSADYIYSNGYIDGGTPDIMTYVPYKIELDDNNVFVIELLSPVELLGWADVCPDIIFGVDVPTKYEMVDLKVYDPVVNGGSFVPHGFKNNIRYSTITRDGVVYNSYLRNANGYYESSDVKGDPSLETPYKYEITIKLKQ